MHTVGSNHLAAASLAAAAADACHMSVKSSGWCMNEETLLYPSPQITETWHGTPCADLCFVCRLGPACLLLAGDVLTNHGQRCYKGSIHARLDGERVLARLSSSLGLPAGQHIHTHTPAMSACTVCISWVYCMHPQLRGRDSVSKGVVHQPAATRQAQASPSEPSFLCLPCCSWPMHNTAIHNNSPRLE